MRKVVFTVGLMVIFSATAAIAHGANRQKRELFRDNVDPAGGGKIPESAALRTEINKIDASGLKTKQAQRFANSLKDTPLPEKSGSSGFGLSFSGSGFGEDPFAHVSSLPFKPGGSTNDQLKTTNGFSNSNDIDDYSQSLDYDFDNENFFFDSFFDSKKSQQQSPFSISNERFSNENHDIVDDNINNYDYFNDEQQPNYVDINQKTHLLTSDPYAKRPAYGYTPKPYQPYSPEPYHPQTYTTPAPHYDTYNPGHDAYVPPFPDHYQEEKPSSPYNPPPNYDPYKPYHENTYDPYDSYKPVHNSYDNYPSDPLDYKPVKPYSPPHDPYKPVDHYAPHDTYKPIAPYKPVVDHYTKPYKPIGPVLLDKAPYIKKEIKSLPVPVHKTYTSFDCRKAPYPDRHYADPEAGCAVYHFCHANGKQDTFYCGKGTIFNEYIGTCDHAEAVYCSSNGKGYAGPSHHQPEPYHEPKYHETQYHEPQHYEPVGYEHPKPTHYNDYHEPSYHGSFNNHKSVSSKKHFSPAYEPEFNFPKKFPSFGPHFSN